MRKLKGLIEVVCTLCRKLQPWRRQPNCPQCRQLLIPETFNRALDNGGCYSTEGNP